jgi:hypothetical protein
MQYTRGLNIIVINAEQFLGIRAISKNINVPLMKVSNTNVTNANMNVLDRKFSKDTKTGCTKAYSSTVTSALILLLLKLV